MTSQRYRSPLLMVIGAGAIHCATNSSSPTTDMVPIVDPEHPDGTFYIDPYEFPNEPGSMPMSYTNLAQAEEFCAGESKRLCTAAEWRRACLGPTGNNTFGYGPQYQSGRCHIEAGLPSGHSSMMNPEELLAISGEHTECATPEGVYDLIGNLEEWVLDDWQGQRGMLEGGAWYTFNAYANCTGQYSREPDYRLSPTRRVYSAGFRCCWSDTSPAESEVARDRDQRLKEARESRQDIDYDPSNEVEIMPGVFMDRLEYPNRAGALPHVVVSWSEANAACQQENKRLCEVWEWEKSCGGEYFWTFPYGDNFIEGACPVSQAGLMPAGHHPGCLSPSGAADMVGGVWEWTATTLDAPVLSAGPGETLKELRGGSWFVDATKGTCAPDDGYPAAAQGSTYPDVGFRCCRGTPHEDIMEPVSGTLTCPDNMVAMKGYCIDRMEYPNQFGIHPEADMSFSEAQQGCTTRGLHVCSESEWSLACGGETRRRWPYGNTYAKGTCHDLSQETKEEGGFTVPSGSQPGCTTPEGVLDLSGNLWEWVASDQNPNVGVLRGGGWNISAGLGQCRARAAANRDFHAGELGTRCCATAAEAAILRASTP